MARALVTDTEGPKFKYSLFVGFFKAFSAKRSCAPPQLDQAGTSRTEQAFSQIDILFYVSILILDSQE